MLYHYQVGFPPHIKFGEIYGLRASAHAMREAHGDRYGSFVIPTYFRPSDWRIVEIETQDGLLHKIVARRPLDDDRDIVMVILPREKVIKTVWINERKDRHKTLNRQRYMTP